MTLKEKISSGDRFARSIGVELTEVREGYARTEITVREDHLNAAGACQGGVYYTLADLAFAAVANSHGIMTLGISNTITFMQSAHLGDRLIAECTEQIDHYKLPYCEIKVRNQEGALLACMTGIGYRQKKEFPFEGLM